MKTTDKHVFFWGGEFSQWYKSNFTINDTIYNCAEQHMMHMKALYFEDEETAQLIMEAESPSQQKTLGKQVKNFDATAWSLVSMDVVRIGNLAKFTANKSLRELLLSFGNRTFVEASPKDTVWGVGMAEDHPEIDDETKWLGENKLGQILTEVRNHFLKIIAKQRNI